MARSSDSFFLAAILKDKTFQAREIRRVILLASLYLLVTTVLLGVFYHVLIGKLVAGTAPLFFVSEDMQRFNEIVPGLASVLGRWIVIMLIVNVLVTTALSVYITRKLGHPLLAIKRALRDISDGDLNVRLRESDESEFSEITNGLNSAMREVRRHIVVAKQEISNLSDLQNKPATNEAELKTAINNCKTALDHFKAIELDSVPPKSANG